jgi:hypothetical protein
MDNYNCWACDFSDKTGEGNLARLFVKKKFTQNNYQIFTLDNIKILNFLNGKILNYKYFSPIIGILFCWYFFLRRKRLVYLNYLPLWNFLLFIFLPPSTLLGPITGGALYKNNDQLFIRKYLFPLFYRVSLFFLKYRNTKLIFSTSLLKKYVPRKLRKKIDFNFVFNLIKKRAKKNKNIDFVIYYKKHKNKINFFPYELVKKISIQGYKVIIVGDYLNITSVVNKGFVSNKKLQELLSRAKYTVASEENIYSIFVIESINNNVKILISKSSKKRIKDQYKNFIFYSSKKIDKKLYKC